MSKILIICVFLALGIEVFGAKPKGCIDKNGKWQKFGTHFQLPGECVDAYCENGGEIILMSCPCFAKPFGCKNTKVIPEDLSKPYPDCCESVKCDDEKI